jgi:hypothetical protein
VAAQIQLHSDVPLSGLFLQVTAALVDYEVFNESTYAIQRDSPTTGPNSNSWAAAFLRYLGVSPEFTPGGPLPLPGWNWTP